MDHSSQPEPPVVARSRRFLDYVGSVEETLKDASFMDWPRFRAVADQILDGEPTAVLRQSMSLRRRKESGAFFTGSDLSNELADCFADSLDGGSRIFDPACGSGDLLLACSRHLPVRRDLSDTLEAWGNQLCGVDVSPEFVRAAKARLALAAIVRMGPSCAVQDVDLRRLFPNVRLGDGLDSRDQLSGATHVVLNPPFGYLPAPETIDWGVGRVSGAAIFFDHVLTTCEDGVNVGAILPDVLRSGSRYKRWRHTVEGKSDIKALRVKGLFGSGADVDVFLLHAVTGAPCPGCRDPNWYQIGTHTRTLGSKARIAVGSVVPHRHPETGPLYPYLTARGLTHDGPVNLDFISKRRFRGSVRVPPFVVVRRTSRPGESPRASGTLVLGLQPVAVENHLLIVSPVAGGREECEKILEVLNDDRTDLWLDKRMRCRHLTVQSLRELPWWD